MFTPLMDLVLSPAVQMDLERVLRQATLRQSIAKRVRVVLALANGLPYSQIGAQYQCTDRFIAIWKRRFIEGGVLALADAPRAGRGHGLSAALEAKIVHLTLHTKPPAPVTHWSTRRLAAKVGVHYSTVAGVWKRHGLKPHRLDRYKASPDPDFETKAADIIGLYLTPPPHAVVFASMRRPRFKRWTAPIPSYRSRPAAPSATGSSTSATAPCRSSRR